MNCSPSPTTYRLADISEQKYCHEYSSHMPMPCSVVISRESLYAFQSQFRDQYQSWSDASTSATTNETNSGKRASQESICPSTHANSGLTGLPYLPFQAFRKRWPETNLLQATSHLKAMTTPLRTFLNQSRYINYE
jgi:hypothetical protein